MRYLVLISLIGLLGSCAVTFPAQAEAPYIVNLGDLPGGIVNTITIGLSQDGTTAFLQSFSASGIEASYSIPGVGIFGLGDLPGGSFLSRAHGGSSNGSVIVGSGTSVSGQEAYRWTSGTGMIGLGDLPGGTFSSVALSASADGSVLAGIGRSASGQEAFRWTSGTGMIGLGDLPGGIFSSTADDISSDGAVIVGMATSASGSEPYRWTSGTGMVGLGDLPGGGYSGRALSVNTDGSIIVGYATSASGSEAFRWTSGTGMIGLGDLPGGAFSSQAQGVSNDGNVIVGYGTIAAGQRAFIWEPVGGMQELSTYMTALGVDLTGWTLIRGVDVSADGTKLAGYGTFSGTNAGWLISLGAAPGLTTVDGLAESLSEARVVHQQATSQMGVYNSRGLFMARNAMSYFPKVVALQKVSVSPSEIEPAAGEESVMGSGYFSPEKWAFYSLGSFATGQENNPDSHAVDGSVGALYRADKNWIVGGGMISGQTSIDLGNGGTNILDSYGGEILSSYQHPSGVRLYLIGFASYLTLDSSRGYMNGGGRSYSYGESEGYGYGGSARLGYEMDVLPERGFTATPYIEAEYSKTHLDHYAEDQGPFPANYSDQSGERVIGRVGVELSHDVGETVTVRGRAAYARRLHDAENDVTASSTGLTMTLTPNAVDDQWAEGGVSVLWQADENMHLFADLSGRTGKTEDPYARATVGLTMGF